jgi:hypothetical protein
MRASRRHTLPVVSVVCVRVFPTERPLWEVTYALHPGSDLHDSAVCAVERQSMVRLIESEGRCALCGALGPVLCERGTVRGMRLCEGCVGVTAQRLIGEAIAAAAQ